MKQSSTGPPKKKLKQARLPFQILSPPVVKNCDLSPLSQCKRKACETASDDDVVVSEINENKITPLEKKAKVISKDANEEEIKSEDACMEVDEGDRQVPAVKKNNKKPNNSNKKVRKSTTSHKTKVKSTKKTCDNESKKTVVKNLSNKPEVVDFVDLCDSPVKKTGKDEESIPTNLPKCHTDASVPEIKNTQSEDDGGDHNSLPSFDCPTPEKDELDSEAVKKENDLGKLKKASTASSNLPSNDRKLSSSDENEEKNDSDEKSPIKEATNEISCSNKDKELALKSKSSSSVKKSNSVKNSLKQPSIKDIVTSKSPKMNTTDSLNNTIQDSNCDKKSTNITEESDKSDSNKMSTPSRDLSPSKNSSASLLDESKFKTPSTANDSLTEDDSSPLSECNASPLSTPGTDPSKKKISKTPRRMTPKQLLLLKEKEEKRKERERLKEEKEKKKAEEKEEKMKLKKEKEEERLRIKQEKEDEKRKEREEKEKKKQAELEQKNEEKRLKEEEKRLKEEEKRAKEEERRKKEEEEKKKKEEKRVKEEQKEAEKRKSAQAFASFFVKTETKTVGVEQDNETGPVELNFQPFEVKNDMRLAPVLRTQLPEERRQLLDTLLECSINKTSGERLYLEQIRSPSYTCGTASRTWPPPDETDDEVIIIESENPNENMEVDEIETEKKPEKRRRRAKLLQFHENRRPPYWGTWRKKSKYIRPRTPLNQDKTMLEYEVDSDDEWEEPEEGESLRGSEDEESQDEQYEEDNDMFVPHGYLSDGEGEDELEDQSPETMKARLMVLQMEFEAERNEKQQKLKPRLIGCVWFCNSETYPSSVGSKIADLFLSRRAVWEGSLPLTVAAPISSPSTTVTSGVADTPNDETRSGTKKKVVKESMIPDIIKTVHGSRKKLTKLLLVLLEAWEKDKQSLPSKRCLADKIRELAAWERPTEAAHHCWYVKEDVRLAFGLTDLDLPPTPSPTASILSPNITKFTKVLTTDERLKLLRESPGTNKEVAKTPPSIPVQNLKPPSCSTKSPTIKLSTHQGLAIKKRVPLITVSPKKSLKQNLSTSIMYFVTKSTKCEEIKTAQNEDEVKVGDKVKKRITPITLTTAISKPTSSSPSSKDDCTIILDD